MTTTRHLSWYKPISILLLLVLLLAALGPSAVRGADPNVKRGEFVYLRASDESVNTFVPPPDARQLLEEAPTAVINVEYHGFSAEAQAAFQYAVDIWARQIVSSVPIHVKAYWQPLPRGVLGGAGPANIYRDWTTGNPPPQPNTWYPIPLANKLAGGDLVPPPGSEENPAHDIEAVFSSILPNWYFGTDGNPPPRSYDFVSVVLHELGHGLGFVGSARVEGNIGEWGLGTGFPFIYDRFVQNGAGQALTNTALFPNPSSQLAALLQSNDLYWAGQNAVSANGGSRPKLYVPPVWQQGSSYSHWDEAVYSPGNPNSLMTPALANGEAIHDPGPVTRGLFTDIGWTFQSTTPPPPPPASRIVLSLVWRCTRC